jgi:predicted transport protein
MIAQVTFNDTIAKVRTTADKLKLSTAGNEANTKALLIEPILVALGWDLGDIDSVEREVKVYEGTYLDYALKVSATPRLYLEAKSISGNLDDKKFVAQAINYANNDGVLWCVLTNGLRYRVYKTNEPVAMEQKMLFEVDLTSDNEPMSEMAKLLRLISRESVVDGTLDTYGERVFTDVRVRKALAELAAKPPKAFVSILTKQLGHPTVPDQVLHRSLGRLLLDSRAGSIPTKSSSSTPSVGSKQAVGPAGPGKGQEYDVSYHLGNKSSLVRELWEAIDDYASSLGSDVTHRIRKQYIGYFKGKRSFCTAEIQMSRVLVSLALTRTTAEPWNETVMRDASEIGHFGLGDIQYSIITVDQLDELRQLIQLAYDQPVTAG